MIELLERYTKRLEEPGSPHTVRLFQKTAYGWLLLNALYFLPIRTLIWGEYSMMMSAHPEQSISINLAYLLDHARHYTIPVYFLYITSIIASLLGFLGRLPRVLVFMGGWMLYYACIPAFNSSWLLYHIFAFYLIFIGHGKRGTVDAVVTNLAFTACRIQFILVYAIAGGYKLTGKTWLHGSSVWNALHLDHFTFPWVRDLLSPFKGLLKLFSWFGLSYQIIFPFLIWFKRFRRPLFIAGLCFHGFIAIAMRLPEFGFAMIAGYTLFFEDALSAKILAWFRLRRKPAAS